MAASRSKTNLACDVCRRRKSRCDGLRPACSHCKASGQECVYRPTPTSLDSDVSVLSRLDDVERRLAGLEERPQQPRAGPAFELPREIGRLCGVPRIHIAAAHKLLHVWPRLRLILSLSDSSSINPLTYLRDSDETDANTLFTSTNQLPPRLPYQVAVSSLERFYDYAHEKLPLVLVFTLANSPILSRDRVVGGFVNQHGYPDQKGEGLMTELDRHLSYEQLLVLSMALRIEATNPHTTGDREEDKFRIYQLSELCLAMCMQQHWQLLSRPDEQCVPLTLALSVFLVYFWDRPFQAIGFLHAALPGLVRLIMKHDHDEAAIIQTRAYVSVHYILKCDIQTEIDGAAATPGHKYHETYTYQPNYLPSSSSPSSDLQTLAYHLDSHIQLRHTLNQILHSLYALDKAYAHPHELAGLIQGFGEELDRWYRALPLEMKFHREFGTWAMSAGGGKRRHRLETELSLRYYTCVFLLHRPVLYFWLHRDMEASVKPPRPPPAPSTQQQNQYTSPASSSSPNCNNNPSTPNFFSSSSSSSSSQQESSSTTSSSSPWVLESCRACIEATALIILSHHSSSSRSSNLSWTDSQYLFAAHLMLVQVRVVPSLCGVLGGGEGTEKVDGLMDMVEEIFEECLSGTGTGGGGKGGGVRGGSVKLRNALILLRGERQGFDHMAAAGGIMGRSSPSSVTVSPEGGGGAGGGGDMVMGGGHGT